MSTQSIILAGRQAGRIALSFCAVRAAYIYIRRALPMGFVGGARLLICFYSYIC